jgi:CRISPR-associated protein Cas2
MTAPRQQQCFLIAYDIADDGRREEVSALLSGYGPRVQYSVFEVVLSSKTAAARLRRALKHLIDPDDDQIRLYPLSISELNASITLGNRRLEERADYWIV